MVSVCFPPVDHHQYGKDTNDASMCIDGCGARVGGSGVSAPYVDGIAELVMNFPM